MAARRYDFSGKTVLVTGASLGVGLATVRRFHDAGANVVLAARRRGPLEEAAHGLDRSLVLPLDVADHDALVDGVAKTVETFGALDGLVNNAGAHFRGELRDRTPEEIATMVDVNLRAPLVLSRLALPHIERARGFIVNVASLAGKVPLDGAATYSATKFGLRAFSFALASEMADRSIRVSVVSPGPIDTGFIMESLDEVADVTFSQQMCTAEDVAEMILACAVDGKRERAFPEAGAKLATLGYLVPELRRRLKPLLAKKGRRVKERLKRERAKV
ncbi:MAG: SDR family NAD(P)-dependent oxidoreductase [Myxococcota bacterium]